MTTTRQRLRDMLAQIDPATRHVPDRGALDDEVRQARRHIATILEELPE